MKITIKKYQIPYAPIPTWPAFSSDGVPGPDAGRESAPSVALHHVNYREKTYSKGRKKLIESFITVVVVSKPQLIKLDITAPTDIHAHT